MACIYTEHDTAPVVEVRVLGRVTQHDVDEVLPKLEAFIAKHGEIRMVEVVDEFEGFDVSTMLDGLKFDYQHLRNITHVAVVSDIGWIGVLTRAASMVMPISLRVFPKDELEVARAWALNPDEAAAKPAP